MWDCATPCEIPELYYSASVEEVIKKRMVTHLTIIIIVDMTKLSLSLSKILYNTYNFIRFVLLILSV